MFDWFADWLPTDLLAEQDVKIMVAGTICVVAGVLAIMAVDFLCRAFSNLWKRR